MLRLYCRAGERLGALHVVCADSESATAVLSLLEVIVRPLCSNPPIHGARIAVKILSDAALQAEWSVHACGVCDRMMQGILVWMLLATHTGATLVSDRSCASPMLGGQEG